MGNNEVELTKRGKVAESGVAKKDDSYNDEEKHAGYGWLFFCIFGMISTLTLYGIALEYTTSGERKLHEMSFVFVTTAIYSTTAYVARWTFNEKHTEISKYNMLFLSCTSIASTYTSIRSLRYVIYPVQLLFKSCKPVPVMLFGTILGKKYPLTKYVNVIIITCGVALFLAGKSSGKAASTATTGEEDVLSTSTMVLGAILLSVSLCFDGLTGAYEDRLMGKDHVEPFDLMYNIQLGKCFISFCMLVVSNELGEFVRTIQQGGAMLLVLGLTGAIGQVFVFLTIYKFGALNCALIGLIRKMLSLVLSFFLYGHELNAIQTVGLGLSITAMIANFYEKGGKKKDKKPEEIQAEEEQAALLSEDQHQDRGYDVGVDTEIGLEPNATEPNNAVEPPEKLLLDPTGISPHFARPTGTSTSAHRTVVLSDEDVAAAKANKDDFNSV